MEIEQGFGYPKSRFPNLQTQSFDCSICQNVCKDPKQCKGCGRLYCSACLQNLKQTLGFIHCLQCEGQNFQNLTQKLALHYNSLEILCKCNNQINLGTYQQHLQQCSVDLPNCLNYPICQQKVSPHMKEYKVCETACYLYLKIQGNKNDWKKNHADINSVINDLKAGKLYNGRPAINSNANQQQNMINNQKTPNHLNQSQFIQIPQQQQLPQQGNLGNLQWCMKNKGSNIIITQDQMSCYLKESAYIFKTVLANKGFYDGEHYWEIIPDNRTENEMKIGISTSNNFSMDTAFCDLQSGYAFYGLGSIRHGSNSSGQNYGKRFKNNGVLGVYLNMNKGILSFSIDGQYMGVAFQDKSLKKGPIYPAIALLHHAGASIRLVPQIPRMFQI